MANRDAEIKEPTVALPSLAASIWPVGRSSFWLLGPPSADELSLLGELGRRMRRVRDPLPQLNDSRECCVRAASMPDKPATDDRAGATVAAPAVEVNDLAARELVVNPVDDRPHLGHARHGHVPDVHPLPAEISTKLFVGLEFPLLGQINE
jgi:hypothetical protein